MLIYRQKLSDRAHYGQEHDGIQVHWDGVSVFSLQKNSGQRNHKHSIGI